jgi:hypothetical protein
MLASLLEYRTQMRVERSRSWAVGTSGVPTGNVAEDGISAHSGFATRGLQMSKLSTLLEVEK